MDVSSAGGIDKIDEKIMLEQFLSTLSTPAQTQLKMLREGYSIAQITDKMQISKQEVFQLGQELRQKWLKFNEEGV